MLGTRLRYFRLDLSRLTNKFIWTALIRLNLIELENVCPFIELGLGFMSWAELLKCTTWGRDELSLSNEPIRPIGVVWLPLQLPVDRFADPLHAQGLPRDTQGAVNRPCCYCADTGAPPGKHRRKWLWTNRPRSRRSIASRIERHIVGTPSSRVIDYFAMASRWRPGW